MGEENEWLGQSVSREGEEKRGAVTGDEGRKRWGRGEVASGMGMGMVGDGW